MPNMNSYTYMHNHKFLNNKPEETEINCNCRNKDTCPLPNSCQTKCTIDQANIDCYIAGYKQKRYLGSCKATFKDRPQQPFNRTHVKTNYSCMPNTYMHNHKVLNNKPNEKGINNCNCRNKETCALPNSCQMKCIIYEANIDCDIAGYKQKCYFGSCEATFKDNFGNYKKSFKHVKHKNDTKLSKELWEIKKKWNIKNYMENCQNMPLLQSKQSALPLVFK